MKADVIRDAIHLVIAVVTEVVEVYVVTVVQVAVMVDVTMGVIRHALAAAITHAPAVVRVIAMDNAHPATDVVPVVVAMVHVRLDVTAVVMLVCMRMYKEEK